MGKDEARAAGRESFARRAWADAFRLLEAVDRESPLDAEDLERLATAAYLIGKDVESEAIRGRAHHELLERGDREGAARSAFAGPRAESCPSGPARCARYAAAAGTSPSRRASRVRTRRSTATVLA